MNKTEKWVDIEWRKYDWSHTVPLQASIRVEAEIDEEAERIVRAEYGHRDGFRIVNVR